MTMLNLETFKVVVKSTKNGGLFIKVGDHKVPYEVSSNMDYMGQATKFVESNLGLKVIGCDYTTLVASKQAVKFIELFKFEELSEKAKEKAIADYLYDSSFTDDFSLDSLTELFESFGFYDTSIDYSLDYSHVPFAKLNGKFKHAGTFELEDLLVEHTDDEIKNIIRMVLKMPFDFKSENLSYYSDTDYEIDNPTAIAFRKILKAVNDYLLQSLEVEYEYQQSAEYITETIISNDLYFDVDGNFVK